MRQKIPQLVQGLLIMHRLPLEHMYLTRHTIVSQFCSSELHRDGHLSPWLSIPAEFVSKHGPSPMTFIPCILHKNMHAGVTGYPCLQHLVRTFLGQNVPWSERSFSTAGDKVMNGIHSSTDSLLMDRCFCSRLSRTIELYYRLVLSTETLAKLHLPKTCNGWPQILLLIPCPAVLQYYRRVRPHTTETR